MAIAPQLFNNDFAGLNPYLEVSYPIDRQKVISFIPHSSSLVLCRVSGISGGHGFENAGRQAGAVEFGFQHKMARDLESHRVVFGELQNGLFFFFGEFGNTWALNRDKVVGVFFVESKEVGGSEDVGKGRHNRVAWVNHFVDGLF